MRLLALLFVLFSTPALAAADYSPWPDAPATQLAQAAQKPGQTPGQPAAPGQSGGGGGSKPTGSLSGGDYPGRYCCVHCRPNEAPCGGLCVSKAEAMGCKKPAGCACPGKP